VCLYSTLWAFLIGGMAGALWFYKPDIRTRVLVRRLDVFRKHMVNGFLIIGNISYNLRILRWVRREAQCTYKVDQLNETCAPIVNTSQ
jgi:hypothetical protein